MSDWNDKANGGRMVLSETQKQAGLKSLRIDPLQVTGNNLIKILIQSESDSPAHVNYEWYSYFAPADGYATGLALYFRYQDTDNFYALMLAHYYSAASNLRVWFVKRVAGAETWGDFTQLAACKNQWTRWKAQLCVISDVAYALLYKEVASSWVLQLTKTISPELWSGGGGCGIGCMGYPCGTAANNYNYLDETKIYY